MTEELKKRLQFKRPILALNKPKLSISVSPSANRTNKNNSSYIEANIIPIQATRNSLDLTVTDEKNKTEESKAPRETKHSKNNVLSREAYKNILNDLRTKFPGTFLYPPKPFSIGIHNELYEMTEYSKTTIRRFLFMYCGSLYKKSLTLNAERINLKGQITSIVTEEQLPKEKSKKAIVPKS